MKGLKSSATNRKIHIETHCPYFQNKQIAYNRKTALR